MHQKRGNLLTIRKNEDPILVTPEGKSYKVSYLTAFVWDLLDGSRGINDLVGVIEESGNLSSEELPEIVGHILRQLSDVNLIEMRDSA